MKKSKKAELTIDWKGTHEMRRKMAQAKKVKVTINLDEDSVAKVKKMATEQGASYQKLINQILSDALVGKSNIHERVSKLEKELAKLKKKLVA